MSIDRCKWCSQLVDTDDEPEAYVELPTYTSVANPVNPGLKEPTKTICLCHVCRDDFYEKYGHDVTLHIPSHNRYNILALVSGLPSRLWPECPLVILQAYVDDTNKGNEPVFALGGLVAPVEKWLPFTDAWDAKLHEPPSIHYFKASEAAALHGQFRDWKLADRDRKVAVLGSKRT